MSQVTKPRKMRPEPRERLTQALHDLRRLQTMFREGSAFDRPELYPAMFEIHKPLQQTLMWVEEMVLIVEQELS